MPVPASGGSQAQAAQLPQEWENHFIGRLADKPVRPQGLAEDIWAMGEVCSVPGVQAFPVLQLETASWSGCPFPALGRAGRQAAGSAHMLLNLGMNEVQLKPNIGLCGSQMHPVSLPFRTHQA